MQVDTSIPYLGSWVFPEPKSGDDAWLAFNLYNGSIETAKAFASEVARIRASAEYNDYANPALKRQAAIAAYAKTLLAGRTARYQDLLDRTAATIATNLRTLQTKSNNAVDAQRAAAIWRFLSDLPGGDATRKIEHAARTGDRESLAAALSAPAIFGFIPNPQDRERLSDALLRATDSDAYERLIDLRAALEVAANAWARCQSFILSGAGLPGIESTGA